MYVAKAKVLISCAVIAQLIYPFVLSYEKRFSHDTHPLVALCTQSQLKIMIL